MLAGDTCRLLDLEVLALLLPLLEVLVADLVLTLVAAGRLLSPALVAELFLTAGAGVLLTLVFVLVVAGFALTLVVLVFFAAVLGLLLAVLAGAFWAL